MLALMSDAERQEMFATMDSMHEVRTSPATVTPATLLVAGKAGEDDGDSVDPAKSADYIAWAKRARLRRFEDYMETVANGKIEVVPNAGHNIPKDRPDIIVDAVASFLSASSDRPHPLE
jgi:pimeloyl-ACP methyl ester carboxylesterase